MPEPIPTSDPDLLDPNGRTWHPTRKHRGDHTLYVIDGVDGATCPSIALSTRPELESLFHAEMRPATGIRAVRPPTPAPREATAMSSPVIIPIATGDTGPANRDAHRAGIDDARDDLAAGATTDVLLTRLDWMTEYLHDADDAFTAYTLGYSAAVLAIRLTTLQEAVTA